jgi:hypothetical protein
MVNICMKTLRKYIDQLDEISRRDFIKGAGATAGLAAMGSAQADWQKQADIPGVDAGHGASTVSNYRNTSTDGSAILSLYKGPALDKGQVQSMGITNRAGKWSPKSREPMGAVKIDNNPAFKIEFMIMGNPAIASIRAPGGVSGDAASQKIVSSIVNAKERVAIDTSSLGGGIVQFRAGNVSEDAELDEAIDDAVQRVEELFKDKR